MTTDLLEQAKALSPGDQLELVEALWDEISRAAPVPLPTEAQRAELVRRLEDHQRHPDDALPWATVKASALAKLKARSEQ